MAHVDFDEFLKTLDSKPDKDKKADFLLLTCMDFRFFLKISERMIGRKYDHVILAGAALGVVQKKKPHWGKTFFDHLGLAIELHEVHTVIVMEHRECGAYGPDPGFDLLPEEPDPEDERRVHCEQVELLRKEIHKYDSELEFCSFLLDVPDPTQDPTFDQLD